LIQLPRRRARAGKIWSLGISCSSGNAAVAVPRIQFLKCASAAMSTAIGCLDRLGSVGWRVGDWCRPPPSSTIAPASCARALARSCRRHGPRELNASHRSSSTPTILTFPDPSLVTIDWPAVGGTWENLQTRTAFPSRFASASVRPTCAAQGACIPRRRGTCVVSARLPP